jgi:hypothetical protein
VSSESNKQTAGYTFLPETMQFVEINVSSTATSLIYFYDIMLFSPDNSSFITFIKVISKFSIFQATLLVAYILGKYFGYVLFIS